ncbi:MAG: ABC transporter permease [Phycisphaerae bacterium]|nr:ABC transporter permease [Phycisphaerae bacterium]
MNVLSDNSKTSAGSKGKAISKLYNLVLFRTIGELKSESTRTYAGYLWWIFEPLLSLGVYYVAFKYIFHRDTENFAIFLFIGIVIYRFFSGTVTRGASSIMEGHGLMQLVYFHKSLFPLSVIMVNLVKFLITIFLVIVIVTLCGIMPTWTYLALPVLIVLALLVVAGISIICAAITPFFPDFRLFLNTIIYLMIFLSGVFYDIGTLPPKAQTLLRLNPIAVVIEQTRLILLHGQWPNFQHLLLASAQGVLLLIIGLLLVHKFNRYYPKIS